MKTKFVKKVITMMSAAVMTISCAVGSVGAFRVSKNAHQNFTNRVGDLNAKINNYEALLDGADSKLLKFIEESDGRQNQEISKIIRYMTNYLKKLSMHSNKDKCIYSLIDLESEKIYDDDSFNKIRNMVDDLEKHNGNKKILKYTGMQTFFGKDSDKVSSIISEIYKKVKEGIDKHKQNKYNISYNNFLETCAEYNRVCSIGNDLKFVLGTEELPEELQKELRILTGRGDNKFEIGEYRFKVYAQNIKTLNALLLKCKRLLLC